MLEDKSWHCVETGCPSHGRGGQGYGHVNTVWGRTWGPGEMGGWTADKSGSFKGAFTSDEDNRKSPLLLFSWGFQRTRWRNHYQEKLLPLKSLPIRLCLPSPFGSLYHSPSKLLSCPTRLSENFLQNPILTGARLCNSRIWRLSSSSSAGSFSSAKPYHAVPVGLARSLKGLRWGGLASCWAETSCGAHWSQMGVGR